MTTCRFHEPTAWAIQKPTTLPALQAAGFMPWPFAPSPWQLALYQAAYEQAMATTHQPTVRRIPEPSWN